MKLLCVLLLLSLLAACQSQSPEEGDLPTLAVLENVITPSDTPVPATDEVPTDAPTLTPESSKTPVPSATSTPLPTNTDIPETQPPTLTPDSAATSTTSAQSAPRFATLTPNPGGNRTTPQVLADVIITEGQFQEIVNRRVATIDSIESAFVDFVPEGIEVQLTATGGAAFITAEVLVAFDVAEGFVQISIGDIRMNAAEPPEEFLTVVGGDFFTMMVETFSELLTQQLGAQHDLETLVIQGNTMEITLLVPEQ
ncbi:MAG: hypothetical protein K8L99_11620 [Anaerolineae bacterium]|nr:hypothetical protein [Anaerolineae bacterium]